MHAINKATKSPIVATVESIYGHASLVEDGFERNLARGGIKHTHSDGGTKMFWDTSKTVTENDQVLYVDDDDNEVPADQVELVDELPQRPPYVLTEVCHTDTEIRAEETTLMDLARWLKDVCTDHNTTAAAQNGEAEVENPLRRLVEDDRRQMLQPEGRETLIGLLERMADGRINTPSRWDDQSRRRSVTERRTVRKLAGALATTLAQAHQRRPDDHLLYDLN